MMVSILLAQIIGLYCILIGIAMLVHPARFKAMLNDFAKSPAVLSLAGIISLILGIILVVFHNFWIAGWPVLITLIAWITLIRGIIDLFIPEFAIKMAKRAQSSPAFYFISAIITLIVGLILGYYGFIAW